MRKAQKSVVSVNVEHAALLTNTRVDQGVGESTWALSSCTGKVTVIGNDASKTATLSGMAASRRSPCAFGQQGHSPNGGCDVGADQLEEKSYGGGARVEARSAGPLAGFSSGCTFFPCAMPGLMILGAEFMVQDQLPQRGLDCAECASTAASVGCEFWSFEFDSMMSNSRRGGPLGQCIDF